jgi:hypothetical protein
MASTATTGFSIPAPAQAVPVTLMRSNRRRRITPQAGRALETLAHAIEYLTDEYAHQNLAFASKNEQLEAVRLLMALNRQVYFECPEIPTFADHCRAWLHLHSA